MKVLLVEDSAVIRGIIRGVLKEVGCDDVEEAEDGFQALLKLDTIGNAKAFDLIITDLAMPRCDGFEFIKAIKSRKMWRSTPILVVSEEVGKDVVIRATKEGIDGYVVKPFSTQILQSRIVRLTKRRKK